jgi:hypothetical protein
MNSSGIELNRLFEKSSHCRDSILQITGIKSEEERPMPDRKRWVTRVLSGLHLTPIHEHGFGSLVASHGEVVLLRSLERVIMVISWYLDS